MWDVILGYWGVGGIFGEDIKMTEPHLWAVKSGGNFLEGLRFRPSFLYVWGEGRGSLDQAEDQGLGSWFVGLGKVVAVVVVSPSLFPSQCQDVAVREGDGRI